MYYRRVNRGLSFTKPGVYAFGLVLLVGMVAVTTGINGLYVFLSAGLGGFIVSGMLSELAMKNCTVRSVTAVLADADTPFAVDFSLTNSSSWFAVFALQTLLLLLPPRFRLIARPPVALGGYRCVRINPGETQVCQAQINGMSRGHYQKLIAMHLTTFPFGILEKFKLVDIDTSIMIAPNVDLLLYEQLRAELSNKMRVLGDEREFYSHRNYLPRDSMRNVDWKKSANRAQGDWVVRVYRAPQGTDTVRVNAPWSYAASLADERSYENYLVRVRTLLKVLADLKRSYCLDMGPGMIAEDQEASLMLLAVLPTFAKRDSAWQKALEVLVQRPISPHHVATSAPTLQVTTTSCSWEAA